MSAGCNTCYLAATQPEWVARIVTNMREDKPCERHREGGSNGVSEYTPTTEEVRNRYLSEVFPEDEAEFDRWLAEVKAEAWDEGHSQGSLWAFGHRELEGNPYLEETE